MSAIQTTWVGYPGEHPGKPHPMWPSKGSRKFLCEVDFGFRTDSYFLQRGRDTWFLWHRYLDEMSERQHRNVVAHGDFRPG